MYVDETSFEPYSYSMFLGKWAKLAPFVKRAGTTKDGFCTCDICLEYKRNMRSLSLAEDEREAMTREFRKHVDFQRAQRSEYSRIIALALHHLNDAGRIDKARANARSATTDVAAVLFKPTIPKSASIVLDCGSSQKMGVLPWYGARPPKAFATRQRLECKAMGVIIHGIRRSMFLYDGSVPHGAVMVIDALHRTLEQLIDMYALLCVMCMCVLYFNFCACVLVPFVMAQLFRTATRDLRAARQLR